MTSLNSKIRVLFTMNTKEDTKNTLFLISSYVEPYCRDIPTIMSLPRGAVFRFRYNIKYLSDNFKKILKNDLTSIKDSIERIVLIHATKPNYSGKGTAIARLYPIRLGTLFDIKNLGNLVYFAFKIGDFCKTSVDSPYFEIKKEEFEEFFKTNDDKFTDSQKKELYLKNLVFMSEEINIFQNLKTVPSEPKEENKHWIELINELSKEPEFESQIFMKVLYFGEYEKYIANDYKESNFEAEKDKQYFALKRGLHVLSFIQYNPKIPKTTSGNSASFPIKLRLKTDTQIVSVIKDQDFIEGKYDVIEFYFRPILGSEEKVTFLTIDGESDFHFPCFELPIIIPKRSLRKTVGSFLGFLAILIGISSSYSVLDDLNSILSSYEGFIALIGKIVITIILLGLGICILLKDMGRKFAHEIL